MATLGTPKEAQELDNLSPVDSKRYMHHYNFPPYSTGEVKMLRGQSRREIGHGALAERVWFLSFPWKRASLIPCDWSLKYYHPMAHHPWPPYVVPRWH